MTQLRSDPLPVCVPNVRDKAVPDNLPLLAFGVARRRSNIARMLLRTSVGTKCCVRGTMVNTTSGGLGTSTVLTE